MTNNEAVTLLRNLEDKLDSYCELNEEGKAAFRMAIEVLNCSEIPNNSDLISRQAAIDALNSLQKFSLMDSKGYLHGVGVRLKFAAQKLEQLPSAQPKYRPATLADFPKTMSANEIYSFWERHREVKEMGFVVCKKMM